MTPDRHTFTPDRDPRLAAHAVSAAPAWLWSIDGTQVRWSNVAGAALLQTTPAQIGSVQFARDHHVAEQIAAAAASLPADGAPRLERLRGLGTQIGGLLICQLQRLTYPGAGDAILVVAMDRVGAALPFDQRVRGILETFPEPAAAFYPTGELACALAGTQDWLGGATNFTALAPLSALTDVLRDGHTRTTDANVPLSIIRLGSGSDTVLAVSREAQTARQFDSPSVADTGPRTSHYGGARAMLDEIVVAPPPRPQSPVAPKSDETTMDPLTTTQRFVWATDIDGHFTIGTPAFVASTDPLTAALLGETWTTIATALNLDPDGKIAAALASQATWSALPVAWPAANGGHLAVELSGLPVIDRSRAFTGFRGFGICRGLMTSPVAAATQSQTAAVHHEPAEPVAQPAAPAPIEPPSSKVIAFRPPVSPVTPAAPATPSLTPVEQNAFHEIARELGDRLKAVSSKPVNDDDFGPERTDPVEIAAFDTAAATPAPPANAIDPETERTVLDRLPVGVLVYRLNSLIYANRALLDWIGYRSLDALNSAGGLDALFIEPAAGPGTSSGAASGAKSLAIATRDGSRKPIDGRLVSVNWDGENALALVLNTLTPPAREMQSEAAPDKSTELARREIEGENRNLRTALDTAADGVLLLDAAGRIIHANSSAAALFGRDRDDIAELMFADLFAPESRRAAADYLDRLNRDHTAGILNPGKEMVARTATGGLVPLHITIGRVGPDGEKFCAVLRDITALKKAEEDLINARHRAEISVAEKSEFLTKISHDIRTPLNAVLGFSEVMMEQRFGPIGNDRYEDYVRGIHASGAHLMALLNDLLDLAKIETGKLDLNLTQISLNDIAQQSVAALQPQANRERVIIRTSLQAALPTIVADTRAVRQIVLNLLAHSIKFSGAGGQVIVSTGRNEADEIVLRVRDTGPGLSDRELLSALEPFRNIATSARWGASGTGLDLPITKALAEANRATFKISSDASNGTLVEVAFPATRVIA